MGAIPVILDTDIGSDIDDTWAQAMMLKCPELDVRLIVSDTVDTVYRAKISARLNEIAGRTDVPIGVGIRFKEEPHAQGPWIADYDLARYPGTVFQDGVDAIVRTIMDSPVEVTLICIGPLPNIAEALRREPRIAPRTRFVGMHGCIGENLFGAKGRTAEYNVKHDVPAAQAVFTAPWKEIVITPLDTCGHVRFGGERYQRLLGSADPTMRAVLENYRVWAQGVPHNVTPDTETSVLFDTVAIHLAYTTRHLEMREMGVRITDEGHMVPDASARPWKVAIAWRDLEAYYDELVERLLKPVVKPTVKEWLA